MIVTIKKVKDRFHAGITYGKDIEWISKPFTRKNSLKRSVGRMALNFTSAHWRIVDETEKRKPRRRLEFDPQIMS